ncbi:MAG: winged helix-turn-helix domain-containing protein [Pseudomonadota bacterium]
MKESEISLGETIIDRSTGRLTKSNGIEIGLRHQTRQVLVKLAETPGETVTRQTFFETVWAGTHVGDDSLVQCIAEIRQAIGDNERRIVETVPRKGYRLAIGQTSQTAAWSRNRLTFVGAAVAALVVATAVSWTMQSGTSASGRSVVAVLPFQELGRSELDGGPGESVSHDIIDSLARYSEFDVIARHSSFRFRDPSQDLREIASQLGADFLVQGTQEIRDRTLRVSVQLIDAGTLTNAWVDRFEVPLENMFEINDTIAFRVAHKISTSVVAINAAAPRSAGDVDALILDNRARIIFQSAPRRENWIASLALAQQAVDEFPESEWGYLGRALLLRIGVRFGWAIEGDGALLDEAKTLGLRAVQLGPQNYMAHLALGRVLMQRGEIERSVAALEAAGELNPSSVIVLNALGQAYIYSDKLDDAFRVFDRIAQIDPIQDPVSLWMRAWAEWQAGECANALDSMQSIPAIPPEAMKLLAVIHACLGDTEEAGIAASAFLDRYPDWTLAQELETNARNWTVDEPRDRWMVALAEVGIPD